MTERHARISLDGHGGAYYLVLPAKRESLAKILPDRQIAYVFVGRDPRDPSDLIVVGVACAHARERDGQRRGRDALKHLLVDCGPQVESNWAAEQARVPRVYGGRDLWIGIQYGPAIVRATCAPVLGEEAAREWLARHAGRPMALPSGDVATPLGLDVEDAPERLERPVDLLGLLVSDWRGTVGVRTYCGLHGSGVRGTVSPRAALARWLASADPEIVTSRESLDYDCQRFGARLVFAIRGPLPPQQAPPISDELEALKRRIAELEARPTSAPEPVVVGDSPIRIA